MVCLVNWWYELVFFRSFVRWSKLAGVLKRRSFRERKRFSSDECELVVDRNGNENICSDDCRTLAWSTRSDEWCRWRVEKNGEWFVRLKLNFWFGELF